MNDPIRLLLLLPIIGTTVGADALPANHWPRWRGPSDDGSVRAEAGPVRFSAEAGLAWKVELPGKGCSTPIVWGDRIYLTTPVDGQDGVMAPGPRRRRPVRTLVGDHRKGRHRNGSGSNPSAVTDGRSLFVYFKSGNLAGLDLDGTLRWRTNLQERFAKDTLYWDLGTSPVVTESLVVVAVMHKGPSFIAAFDKRSGELAWKVDRNYDCPVEGDHSYATPIVIDHDGREAVLVWGAEHLTCHDAGDGRLLWSCGGFNPDRKRNWVAVASAVVAGETVVVPYGRGSRLAGVRLGGSGDVTETHRAWTVQDTGAFVPTPAAAAGRVYLLRDRGEVACIDASDGRTVWEGRLTKHRASYYASPTVVGDLLYAPREDGVVMVVRVRGGLELLAENDMGERVIASPVPLADGRLLLRGERHLFCVGGGG